MSTAKPSPNLATPTHCRTSPASGSCAAPSSGSSLQRKQCPILPSMGDTGTSRSEPKNDNLHKPVSKIVAPPRNKIGCSLDARKARHLRHNVAGARRADLPAAAHLLEEHVAKRHDAKASTAAVLKS